MAGFFEFSMMRVRDDIDQHLLAELYYQYITVEDDFILSLFTDGETQLGRVFVNEPALREGRSVARRLVRRRSCARRRRTGRPAQHSAAATTGRRPHPSAVCTSSTMSAPQRSSGQRSTWASAPASAGTRWSTSGGPVPPPRASA